MSRATSIVRGLCRGLPWIAVAGLSFAAAATGCGSGPAVGEDGWARFRGPNGSGVSAATGLPTRFGPDRGLVWRTPLPSGHSSPVLGAGRVFVTAAADDRLLTYALDADTGAVLWERAAPRPRQERLDSRNNPAAPSPATDGEAVYVFFGDYGLVAYELDGRERWRLPLGPFDNAYGMGASPVVVGDLVVLPCDQSTGSFLLAVDRRDGSIRWRAARPEARSGHSTPVVWRRAGGPDHLLVPGSFFLTAYSVADGEKLWWVGGLAFEMKATPVIGPDGERVYIHGTSASTYDDSYDRAIPPFEELRDHDADADGRFAPEEIPDELARRWLRLIDLDADGFIDPEEWAYYRAGRASRGGLYGYRLGGRGDMTEESFLWHHERAVPQLPSPLLYRDVLYIVDDGGVVSLFEPRSGELLDRGRVPGAIDDYYASPVAADGKVYLASATGKLSVLEAGSEIRPLAVNDLDDEIYATPALAAGRIYVRTGGGLQLFAASGADDR